MTYRARTVFAGALVWSAILITALTSPAWFGKQVIRDQERFVETVEETAGAPEVQDKLAALVADELLMISGFGEVEDEESEDSEDSEDDEEEGEEDEEPAESGGFDLGFIISDDIRGDAELVARDFISSPRGQELFRDAVRATHREVIAVIDEDTSIRSLGEDGQMTINLRPILLQVADDLGQEPGTAFLAGVQIPEDAGRFVVTEDRGAVALLITYFRLIDSTVSLLVALIAVCFVGALLVSRQRGTTMMEIGGGLIFLSLFFVGLVYAGRTFLSWLFIREGLARESFRIVFTDLTEPFVRQEINLGIIGACLLGAGFLIHRFFDPDEFDEYIDYSSRDARYGADNYVSWKG